VGLKNLENIQETAQQKRLNSKQVEEMKQRLKDGDLEALKMNIDAEVTVTQLRYSNHLKEIAAHEKDLDEWNKITHMDNEFRASRQPYIKSW